MVRPSNYYAAHPRLIKKNVKCKLQLINTIFGKERSREKRAVRNVWR